MEMAVATAPATGTAITNTNQQQNKGDATINWQWWRWQQWCCCWQGSNCNTKQQQNEGAVWQQQNQATAPTPCSSIPDDSGSCCNHDTKQQAVAWWHLIIGKVLWCCGSGSGGGIHNNCCHATNGNGDIKISHCQWRWKQQPQFCDKKKPQEINQCQLCKQGDSFVAQVQWCCNRLCHMLVMVLQGIKRFWKNNQPVETILASKATWQHHGTTVVALQQLLLHSIFGAPSLDFFTDNNQQAATVPASNDSNSIMAQ